MTHNVPLHAYEYEEDGMTLSGAIYVLSSDDDSDSVSEDAGWHYGQDEDPEEKDVDSESEYVGDADAADGRQALLDEAQDLISFHIQQQLDQANHEHNFINP